MDPEWQTRLSQPRNKLSNVYKGVSTVVCNLLKKGSMSGDITLLDEAIAWRKSGKAD